MMNRSMLTSNSENWTTPDDLFAELDQVFDFTLDPCASRENAKCARFFTKKQDGLAQDWGREKVFMNPPYGRELPRWMKKAYEASLQGALVVCLVPARPDTDWWWNFATKGLIHFIHGRLKFGGATKSGKLESATFPSALVIFYPADLTRFFQG